MSPKGRRIAIVGMAARVPGADNVGQFWHNVCAGVEATEEIDLATLRERGESEAKLADPNYRPVSLVARDLDTFDREFFGFTQREAELCDPQFRLFLELSYTAMEDAGYDPRAVPGRVGVFGGVTTNAYRWNYIQHNKSILRASGDSSIGVGTSPDYVAPLVSYRLGYTGPSVSLYTACSTSNVAVHHAISALERGECEVAIAGGVQIDLPLGVGYVYSDGNIYSRDGHVRPFAANATGTIFAGGGAVVVLKTVAAAEAAGDQIYAVIRGTAVNNDGNRRAGFTAPGVEGQMALVRSALADADVHPRTIGMMEAHGTGTVVGDPIEIKALSEVYREYGDDQGYCWLASVKGNVGHLGPAAGTTGIIKAALAVRHGVVPPTINCTEVNPALELDSSPFKLPLTAQPWSADGPRRAAVSSFGIGGTNAHAIIEEYTGPSPSAAVDGWQALPLSARTPEALAAASTALADRLDSAELNLADVAHTLQVGRAAHTHRQLIVARDTATAVAALRGDHNGPAQWVAGRASSPGVAFLFPGQGAQYPSMGRGLYTTEPVYRDAIDECAEILRPLLGLDLRDLLHAEVSDAAATERLNGTAITQPAVFAVEWALAQLWRSAGVTPTAMIGHSVGEITAACVAGVFRLPDALRLVAERGALMASMPGGAMIALPLAADAVRPMLPPDVTVAAANSPTACVVAGSQAAIDEFSEELDAIGIAGTMLRTSHAFHSASMDPILGRFEEVVAGLERSAPRVPYLSNVTGDWITDDQAVNPAYWAAQLRGEVRFADGLRRLRERGDLLYLEVGPGQALSGFTRQQAVAAGVQLTTVATLRRATSAVADEATWLAAVGAAWVHGIAVDWAGGAPSTGRRVSLPTYPYERRRYFIEPDPIDSSPSEFADANDDPLLNPLYVPAWRQAPRTLATDLTGEVWLLVSAADNLTPMVAAAATAAGVTVLRAGPGQAYTFDPGNATDVARMLQEVMTATGATPHRIVHALPLAQPPTDDATMARRTYQEMATFAKGLLRVVTDPVELIALTDRVWSVGGEEATPAAATVLGPLRTLPRELPAVRVRHLDLDLTTAGRRLAEDLVAELATTVADDAQIALRGRRRWLRTWASSPNTAVIGRIPMLRERGVYLVTGGLGGLGLAVAQDLARTVQARLVLLGRRELPPRREWDAVLADPNSDAGLRERIQGAQHVIAAGGEVLVLAADVADATTMAAAVARAIEHFGAIHGVIHAAGLPGGQLLAAHDQDAADAVLAAKVTGTLVLHRLIATGALPDLDFLALFSSIIAVTADYGHCDYVGANSFMDAYAAARVNRDPYVVSINWCGWREVGMISATGASDRLRELRRLRGADPDATAPAEGDPLAGRPGTPGPVEPVAHPLLHSAVRLGPDNSAQFEVTLKPDSHWVLTDHRIAGVGVMPGTSLLEMVRAAAHHLLGTRAIRIEDVVFIDPVRVATPTLGRLALVAGPDNVWDFTISFSADGDEGRGTVQCRGRVRLLDTPAPAPLDLAAYRAGLAESGPAQPYSGLVEFGPHFQAVAGHWHSGDRGLVELRLPVGTDTDADRYWLHPSLLDRAVYGMGGAAGHAYLPLLYRAIEVYRPLPVHCWVAQTYHVDPSRPDFVEVDEVLIDADGHICAVVEGYTLRSVGTDGAPLRPATVSAPDTASQHSGNLLSTSAGQELFRRILAATPTSQVVVCIGSLGERIAQSRAFNTDAITAAAATNAVTAVERSISGIYVEPETTTQRSLALLWGEALGVTRIGIDDDFFELGGSSLTAVQLTSRIRSDLKVEVSVGDLFEHSTIRLLAAAAEAIQAAAL